MMKMSSNSAKSSKHHKNRSSMPASSNVHNQKQMNRNSMRSSNGQMQTSVNHYNHNQAHQNTPRPNNVSNYSNSNNTNYNLDEVGINGVYKNGRLMHSVTSLIGCLVEVELANGDRYEGIFKTFSPEFDLVLFSAAKIINDNTDKTSIIATNVSNLVSCLEKKSEFLDKIVFHLNDMVNIKALNVDLDYATISKKSVLTDSEIAKTDGKKMQPKELVPWDDDGANNYESLEENGMSNGWNSADMFHFNEKTYNIKTTFRDEMSEYTIQLEQRNDDDYLKRQAQAESIAREIEKDPNRLKRLAKENDLDEETRFSAVVANKRDEPNNLSSNISSPRSEISHSSRDDRREPMRNNPDNAGFRTQNSRQSRNRGGANRNSGVNDSNWREPAARTMNSNRFNQAQPAYNNNNFNPKQQTSNNPSSGYGPAKYPSGGSGNVSNVGSNQYSSASGPKSSYSAVSARHTSSESLANENETKVFPNRGHGNKSDHNYPNEDSYNRRSGGGLPQRDFKQRSGSRIAEHDSAKLSNNQVVSVKSEVDCSKSNLSSNISPATVAGTLPTSSNEPSQLGSQPKAPSPAKSESSHNQQSISKGRPMEDNSQPVNSSKVVELKKQEQQMSHTNSPSSTMPSNEASKQEVELKNDLSQVSSVPTVPVLAPSQPNSAVPLPTPVTTSIENRESTTPTSTCSTSGGNEVVKSSLNPNAKAFTPRSNSTPQFMQQPSPQVVPNYQQYQAQHLSTTPPAPMPNQFIQMQHSLPPQHHHHHPQSHQQQQAHQLARNNAFAMQFQPAYISSQIPPQYLTNIPMTQMAPNAIPPHTVFPGAVPAGVSNPAVPTQTTGPNQSGPGQLPSHHMVANPAGPQQTVPNQNQQPQGPQSRGSYRGSNKGANHNSGPHQQNQQYIRQHQVDYSQQTQVANVTGQPIMAATAPQAAHQMPVAYSAASVLPQHHNQTQQHGQQPPNMAQMVPQPNPMQYMQYARHFIPPGHQINLAAPMQPGLYDPNIQMMICDHCPPQMVPTQPIPTAVPQTNPNLQSSAPSISSSAPSNQSTANQVSQGAAPQAPLNY